MGSMLPPIFVSSWSMVQRLSGTRKAWVTLRRRPRRGPNSSSPKTPCSSSRELLVAVRPSIGRTFVPRQRISAASARLRPSQPHGRQLQLSKDVRFGNCDSRSLPALGSLLYARQHGREFRLHLTTPLHKHGLARGRCPEGLGREAPTIGSSRTAPQRQRRSVSDTT
jgi:hypothetical protein